MLENFRKKEKNLKKKLQQAKAALQEKDAKILELQKANQNQAKELEERRNIDIKQLVEKNNEFVEKLQKQQQALLQNFQTASLAQQQYKSSPSRTVVTYDTTESINSQQTSAIRSDDIMDDTTHIVEERVIIPESDEEEDKNKDSSEIEKSIRMLEAKENDLRKKLSKPKKPSKNKERPKHDKKPEQFDSQSDIIQRQQKQIQELLYQQRYSHQPQQKYDNQTPAIKQRLNWGQSSGSKAEFNQVSDELFNTLSSSGDMRQYLDNNQQIDNRYRYQTSTPARQGSPNLRLPATISPSERHQRLQGHRDQNSPHRRSYRSPERRYQDEMDPRDSRNDRYGQGAREYSHRPNKRGRDYRR